jgi:hypothetical protein
MKRRFAVSLAVASLLAAGCEKHSAPTPETASTPEASATAVNSPTPTGSAAESPSATRTATPEATPAAQAPSPAPASTPEPSMPSPTSSPTVSPGSASTEPDGRPTLSSQSANDYLESYDAYIRDFKSAFKAMKQGDVSKYKSVIRSAIELQTKSEKLSGELNPEEEQRFANYLRKKENELTEFASENR